jgi:hypothetical protein
MGGNLINKVDPVTEFLTRVTNAPAKWEIYVGNIGNVYSGTDSIKAKALFTEYVQRSKNGDGRAAGERVTLVYDHEILQEYPGSSSNSDDSD